MSPKKILTLVIVLISLTAWPSLALAQANLNVFSANSSAGSVSLFRTNSNGTLSAIQNFPVGTFPHYIAVSPDSQFAYVSNRDSNNISVVSAAGLAVVQTVPASNSPYGIALTPDGGKVLVANRLAPAGCVLPSCSPLIQVFSRNASTGLLTASNTIDTLNTAQLRGITVLQDAIHAYVVDQSNNRALVVNLTTNLFESSINVGNQPLGIASNPTGTRVYVANFTSANVSVIDTSSNTVIATPAAASGGTFDVDVTPDGRFFYSANASGQTVSQFNAISNTALGAPVATGQDPDGLTVSPDGANLYVTNASNTDEIAFFTINATTGVLTANGSISAPNNPLDVAMRRYVILPPAAAGPPAVSGGTPARPTWVGVRRNNLALLIDFAAPEGGGNDLDYRIYVTSLQGYPVATLNARSSGVLVPYIRNEEAYWVVVTAINNYGEGATSVPVLVPVPDWAFYPKDRDGRPCPTPAQCQ